MANTITGGVFDLYREQIVNNSTIYTGANQSDSFRQSAVRSASPTNPGRPLAAAYGSQQTVDSWIIQLRQKEIQI